MLLPRRIGECFEAMGGIECSQIEFSVLRSSLNAR